MKKYLFLAVLGLLMLMFLNSCHVEKTPEGYNPSKKLKCDDDEKVFFTEETVDYYEYGPKAVSVSNINIPDAKIPETLKKKEIKTLSPTESYIKRFLHVAQYESEKFGIPVSIKLAQGILESGYGKSRLCKKSNNHFGIKWNKYHKGGYIIAADDKPDDRFRKYKSAWYSYRDHSKFLAVENRHRYGFLFKLKKTDYKGWARGLQKAGYATSKTYAKKLISIIETYNLDEYDK